ncbi:hypothetical protein QTP86_005364 [Hemibagrus guttatus]|nr:hypothetical protein QTP86_005364 [Hemibagrus guttatus]
MNGCEQKKHLDELITTGIEDGMMVKNIEGKGRGVFATQRFQKGQYVVEYHGDLLLKTDAKKREAVYSQEPDTGCYMYYFQYLTKTYCVDATKETDRLGRLINHSKNGNCQTKLHDINGIPHLILVASRDIEEGEELLYDYGDRSKASIAAHPLSEGVYSGCQLISCEKMNEWSALAKVYDPLKAGSIDSTDVEPHDRAIWRAMNAHYQPNKGVTGDPQLTLFVARLNKKTTEEDLCMVFSKFGDIRRLRLVRDAVTGFSKGYAFIEYKEERSLMRAWRDGNKMVVDQHELFVDFEQERTLQGWIPRRLGGGLGGKKESGQLRFGGRDRPFRRPINLPAVMPRPGDRWRDADGGREERLRDERRDMSPGWDREHGRQRNRRDDWERGNERGGKDHHKDRRDSRRHRDRSNDRESNRGKDERRYRDSYRDSDKR